MPIATSLVPTSLSFNGLATISPDGRYVAYATYDVKTSNGELYVQDLIDGHISLVTTIPGGYGTLATPVFSADGTKLAYGVPTRDNNPLAIQIYVKDLQTGTLQLASSNSSGEMINRGVGWQFNFSQDGKQVVFVTSADNLAANDNNRNNDVFIKNLVTGAVTLVSQNSSGEVGNVESRIGQVSSDGRYVLFSTSANNLMVGDSTGVSTRLLLLKDMQTGTLKTIYSPLEAPQSEYLANETFSLLSANGQKVVFSVGDSKIGGLKLLVKDLKTGITSVASSDASGKPLADSNLADALSSDGRYLTFTSEAANVLPGDGDGKTDVYQKDLLTGALQLLTPHEPRTPSGFGNYGAGASSDGQHILITTSNNTIFGYEGLGKSNGSSNFKLFVLNLDGSVDVSKNVANNLLGGSGADRLAGGLGNDAYWINHSGDTIVEASNGGIDTAFSLIKDFTLPDNVENLRLSWGTETNLPDPGAQNGTGNNVNNLLTGNSQPNILRGLGGNDMFILGDGDDTVDGGSGIDTVIYDLPFDNYYVQSRNGTVEVYANSGDFDLDQLQNIERIQFSDKTIEYGGEANVGKAYRIYQAAFNRKPDANGLGFWIKQIDHGVQLPDIARGFMGSNEFKKLYGSTPSANTLAQKFYENVLHRTPDAGGLTFWVDVLNKNPGAAADVLVAFSESPENQAALVGVINAGVTFTLYA